MLPTPQNHRVPPSLLCSKSKFEKVNVMSVGTKNSRSLSIVSFLCSSLYVWSGLIFRHCRLHGCCPGLILRLLHCSEILMTVSSQPTAMMPCCTAWSIKILKYIHFMCLSVRKYSSSSFATPSVAHCCFALKTGWFLSLSSWLGYWERIILLSALVTGKPLVCTKNNWKSSEQI